MSPAVDRKLQSLFEHNYGEGIRIAKRLNSSLQRLQPIFPLADNFDGSLSEEQIDSIDAFRTRFADLQDCLGNKVFRSILNLEEEPCLTMLDTLNNMEKRRIIDSLQQWRQLRELRNTFSHDYPEAQAERAEALNMAFKATPILLGIMSAVRTYITNTLELELPEPPNATLK